MADDLDIEGYIKRKQQSPPPTSAPTPTDAPDVSGYLRGKGVGPPPASDWIKQYAPGFGYGLAQSAAAGATEEIKAGETVGNLPYVGRALKTFPFTRPFATLGDVVPKDARYQAQRFAEKPYTMPGQQAGYMVGEAGQVAGTLAGGLAATPKAVMKEAALLGGWEGAWTLGEYLTHNVLPHGMGIPAWVMARLIMHGGRKMVEAIAGKKAEEIMKKAGVKALGESELKGAKGASTFIPAPKETSKAIEKPSKIPSSIREEIERGPQPPE